MLFEWLDNTLGLQMQKNLPRSFDKIRPAVEKASRLRFDQTKLLQLMTVYPDAFQLKFEPVVSNNVSSGQSFLSYALVINPSRRQDPKDPNSPLISPINLVPSVKVYRRDEFVKRLMDITKQRHQDFLLSLNPPLVGVNPEKLTRWHLKFPLDDIEDIVPDVKLLPLRPVKRDQTNVEDVLTRMQPNSTPVQLHVSQSTPPQNNTSNGEGNTEIKKSVDSWKSSVSSSEKILTGKLKGLSKALLDRIRAKEAAKVASELTRSPEVEKRLNHLKQMPPLIRLLRNYFIGENTRVLPLKTVVKKVIDSYPTYISSETVEERLVYLKEELSDWINIFQLKNVSYVKLLNINKKITDLESRLKNEENKLSGEISTATT